MQINKILPYQIKNTSFKSQNEKDIKNLYKIKAQKYPNDIEYLKKLAQPLGLKNDELYKLYSIAGSEELSYLLNNSKRHYFTTDAKPKEILNKKEIENLQQKDYRFNLHIHTTVSDGKMTPLQLIDQASEYADLIHSKDPEKSFTIAITDHDNMDGGKEILKALIDNPEKYKNLKIVLGVELSAIYRNKDTLNVPVSYELIGYCINPYDEKAQKYLETLRASRIQFSKDLIKNVSQAYPEYNFSYEEACQKSNNPKKGIDGFLYSLKDYFKSKSENIDTFEYSLKHLPKNEEDEDIICFEADKIKEAFENSDGFFGIAHPGRFNVGDGRIKDEFIKSSNEKNQDAGYTIVNNFIEYLKTTLQDKFKAIETNYQSYDDTYSLNCANNILNNEAPYSEEHRDSINWLLNFRNIAKNNNLLETGGLDTHSENPFVKK